MIMYRCIGCGKKQDYIGSSLTSYTCPCGSMVFYSTKTGEVFLPVLLTICMALRVPLYTIEEIVGTSDITSPEKEVFIKLLIELGFRWKSDYTEDESTNTLKDVYWAAIKEEIKKDKN